MSFRISNCPLLFKVGNKSSAPTANNNASKYQDLVRCYGNIALKRETVRLWQLCFFSLCVSRVRDFTFYHDLCKHIKKTKMMDIYILIVSPFFYSQSISLPRMLDVCHRFCFMLLNEIGIYYFDCFCYLLSFLIFTMISSFWILSYLFYRYHNCVLSFNADPGIFPDDHLLITLFPKTYIFFRHLNPHSYQWFFKIFFH